MEDFELLNEWVVAWIEGAQPSESLVADTVQAIERGVYSKERTVSERLWGKGTLFNEEPELGGGSVWIH
tara:strand:- start:229 stop:435 length:207 start_codon:yes stop_codon:yes gene_type:complete